MRKMGLVFSHKLTEEQKEMAQEQFGELQFIELTPELKKTWGNVPPTLENVHEYLTEIKEFIAENFGSGDVLLVQGDYAATFHIVNFAKTLSITPVHATTERQAKETVLESGEIKMEHIFKHVLFREYS